MQEDVQGDHATSDPLQLRKSHIFQLSEQQERSYLDFQLIWTNSCLLTSSGSNFILSKLEAFSKDDGSNQNGYVCNLFLGSGLKYPLTTKVLI